MSDAIPVLLSDAIATVINAAVTAEELETLGFTAERSYPDWDDDFEDLKDLAVDVVYVSSSDNLTELDSYSTLDSKPEIDVSVRKRFATSDRDRPGASTGRLKKTSVDPLVRLVEQIYETLASDRVQAIELTGGMHANWIDTTVRTYCDYGRLRQGNFLGVVRVRFDVSKAV